FSPSALPLRATTSFGLQGAEQNTNTYRVQARGLVPGVETINQGTIQTFQRKELVRDQAFYGQEEVVGFNERLLVAVGFHADRSSADGDQNHFFFYPKAARPPRSSPLFPTSARASRPPPWGHPANDPTTPTAALSRHRPGACAE